MKITDLNVAFTPGQRPRVIVKLDRQVIDAINEEPEYRARYHKDTNTWIYRADLGDFVSTGAELKGETKRMATRLRMKDGLHTIHSLHATNGPAVNYLFTEDDPVMDVLIDERSEEEPERIIPGHVNAIQLAKYLFASTCDMAMAVVQWPMGLKVYEIVQIVDGEPRLNRLGDSFVFVARENKDFPTNGIDKGATLL